MIDKKVIAGLISSGIILLLSFSANPPQGRTGGPGEQSCATSGCHSGVNPAIKGSATLTGLPDSIVNSKEYTIQLQLIVDQGSPQRGGFQMMALSESEQDIHSFINPGPSTVHSNLDERKYWEHNPAANFTSDILSYQTGWHLDSTYSENQVIFHGSAVFANGNGSRTGDRAISFSDTIPIKKGVSIEEEIIHASCPKNTDGSIILSVENVPGTFDLIWSTGDTTTTANNLGAGTYYVTLVTSENISEIDSFTIEDADVTPPIINLASDTFRIQSCAPFSYPVPTAIDSCGNATIELWQGKGSNESFPAGIHEEIYLASDESGNTVLCTLAIINEVQILASTEIENIPCFNDSTGAVEILISGDHPPFEVFINQSNNIPFDSLAEGHYELCIQDASGCMIKDSFKISRPEILQISLDKVEQPMSSSSGDGLIEITVSGGIEPYSFQWKTEDENFSEEEDLELLFPGRYFVHITDANDCQITSDTITLDATTNSLDLIDKELFSIVPNPVMRELRFDFDQNLELSKLMIFNQLGQIVFRSRTVQPYFDISHLPPGDYVVHLIVNRNEILRGRFIKL